MELLQLLDLDARRTSQGRLRHHHALSSRNSKYSVKIQSRRGRVQQVGCLISTDLMRMLLRGGPRKSHQLRRLLLGKTRSRRRLSRHLAITAGLALLADLRRRNTPSTMHKARDLSSLSVRHRRTHRRSLLGRSLLLHHCSNILGDRVARALFVYQTARLILRMVGCQCSSHLSVHRACNSSLL